MRPSGWLASVGRVDREAIGSWLNGPDLDPGTSQRHPGERLGLPEHGPGSVAGWPRRCGAILADWAISWAVVAALGWDTKGFATLGVFAAQHLLLESTLGYTIGKRLFGLRLVGRGGGNAMPLALLVRTLLLCLAIPPVVTDADRRGLHDRAAGTTVVRL